MPYSVASRNGRWFVTSPKGKVWKTSYKDQPAADKAISYIEGRFGASAPVSSAPSSPQPDALVEPEHLSTQDLLDMEAKGERGAKTLLHLRNKESSF